MIIHNPFASSARFDSRKLQLSITGSVACYKAAELLRAFCSSGLKVSVTLSRGAREFLSPLLFKSLGAEKVYGEMFAEGDDVFAHLEPGTQAEAMLVAPASANAIARLAAGFADDMFSAQALAFTGAIVVAPAMNPRMWANSATCANIATLRQRGCAIVEPGVGGTACGEEGQGRLAELQEIFLYTLKALSPQDMAGLNVMVTLGPTREPWDGVRFWSNPSTGRMGAALATCAWLRGASVTAICGPGVEIYMPAQIRRIDIGSAKEMFEAACAIWENMNIGMFSAAVSDFAPMRPAGENNVKVKKRDSPGEMNIIFRQNPDILKTLAARKTSGQKVLGFAAEIAEDITALSPLANLKLESKKADLIAANRVNPGQSAFGADMDSMVVVDRNGHEEIWSLQPKADVAWGLCSWLLRI